jgi:hypothetical protein
MRDPNVICGIRLRFDDGRKKAVRGSREGLIVPNQPERGGVLCIAEGPTDTAALLSIGLWAIGRPSCNGAVEATKRYIEAHVPSRVVIIADHDEPGRLGAIRLAIEIGTREIYQPPVGVKDAREWVRQGATRRDVIGVPTAAADLRAW